MLLFVGAERLNFMDSVDIRLSNTLTSPPSLVPSGWSALPSLAGRVNVLMGGGESSFVGRLVAGGGGGDSLLRPGELESQDFLRLSTSVAYATRRSNPVEISSCHF